MAAVFAVFPVPGLVTSGDTGLLLLLKVRVSVIGDTGRGGDGGGFYFSYTGSAFKAVDKKHVYNKQIHGHELRRSCLELWILC